MIIVITERDEESGQIVTSHGVDMDTFENIVLPWVHPSHLGAKLDLTLGEWVIDSQDVKERYDSNSRKLKFIQPRT